MRRVLPLFLMLLFGLWPLAGFMAAGEDARLPPCCRRHGAHHCAMYLAARARLKPARTPQLEAPATCPSYPRTLGGASAPTVALGPVSRSCLALELSPASLLGLDRDALTGIRITPTSRGPPALLHN